MTTKDTDYRAGWGLILALCIALALLLGLSNRAGAAELPADTEWTYWGIDTATGQPFELLKPEYYTRAHEAAGAGWVVGSCCQWYGSIQADAKKIRALSRQ